jgi:hypothetical protein
VVILQERPNTIDTATKKTAKKAGRRKKASKRQRTMEEYGSKKPLLTRLQEFKNLYLYIIINVDR